MPQLVSGRYQSLFKSYKDQRHLYLLSFVVLFWTLFDSIMTYITPLVITKQGYSNTIMGLIYASSSIVGGIFDFLICRLLKNTHFRRVFLLMFILCLVYPLMLWQAKTVWMFLIVMGIWGVYWDLYGFGTFDFISRYTKTSENSKGFGIISVFRSLGNIIAPIIAGILVAAVISWKVFAFSWLFLAISFAFFGLLLVTIKKIQPFVKPTPSFRKRNLFVELHLWERVGKRLLPVLFLTFFLYFVEAFFWTLSPLLAESLKISEFGGFLIAAFTLPALMTGWFVGSFTGRFGKKRAALVALLLGSFILSFFSLLERPFLIILLTFFSALFISISLPAINGAYADYIAESNKIEGEIEGLADFSFNLGYVLGPVCAGFFADLFGIAHAFSVVGIIGVVVSLFLLVITPKHIILKAEA